MTSSVYKYITRDETPNLSTCLQKFLKNQAQHSPLQKLCQNNPYALTNQLMSILMQLDNSDVFNLSIVC